MCLSPVGLSTVTKLAPAKLACLMVGVRFPAAAIGNKFAGSLEGLFDETNARWNALLFGSTGVVVPVAAGALAVLSPRI